MLHPLVLTSLMVAASGLPFGPVAKLVLVSIVGVPASFLTGRAVTALPGPRHLL